MGEVALIVCGVVGALLVLVSRRRSEISAVLVGLSAGLVAVQVLRIHLFTFAIVLWLLTARRSDRRASSVSLALLCSALVLASTALIGDLVNSPTLALQLIALAGGAAAVAVASSARDRELMLYGLLAMLSASSLVGLLQVVGVVPTELWHVTISALGRPTGFYPEPDWLGMFAGLGALLAWNLRLAPALRSALLLVNVAAWILAFARAAWIAVAAVVLVGLLAALAKRLTRGRSAVVKRGRWGAVWGLACVAVLAFALTPTLRRDLLVRLGSLFGADPTDISGEARLRQTNALLELASEVPPWGHGISAAGRVSVWGVIDKSAAQDNNVASNWILGMWVDGAFFAVPLIAVLLVIMLRALNSTAGLGILLVLVNSLFSNGTYFPVLWLLVGLACAEVSKRRARALHPSASHPASRPVVDGSPELGLTELRFQDR